MRPEQGFAIDIFLEQAFTHHQAEVATGVAPGLVGFLVDDVAQVVEATGHGGATGGEPILARLTALPGAGGEAQNLGLHAAPFERAGHDVGADRGD